MNLDQQEVFAEELNYVLKDKRITVKEPNQLKR